MNLSRLRGRLAAESGQVLVLAMSIILIGTVLGLGAVGYALSSGQVGAHDAQRRTAQQAADAGVAQQLYQQSNANAIGYTAANGDLGSLAQCEVSKLGASTSSSVQSTLVRGALSVTGGACMPLQCMQVGPMCPGPSSPKWTGLDNGDYYLAELCPNTQPQSQGAAATMLCAPINQPTVSSSLAINFPEIVSVGCHSPSATCDQNPGANQFAKQLALVRPTAPLQSIEGENNVAINNTNTQSCTSVSLAGLCLTATVPASLTATVLNGNIIAGNALQIPGTTLGLSTSTAGNLVSNQVNNLLGLVGLVSPGTASQVQSNLGLQSGQKPVSLVPTLEYGKCFGTSITPGYGASGPASAYTCSGTPPAASGNFVQAGQNNPCQAGNPSTACTLTRSPFRLGARATVTPPDPTTGVPMSATLSGATLNCTSTSSAALNTGAAGNCYSNGDLSLTSGTLSLAPGTYVFCNVYIGGSAGIQGPTGSSTGAVQIYLLSPASPQCSQNATGANEVAGTACSGQDTEGNFLAAGGVSNQAGGQVNGLTSTVDPSNLQIYVSGDTNDTGLAVDNICQPRTRVTIGGQNSGGLYTQISQAFVLYAPRSNVQVQTSLAFEGSVIGWNVNLTALAVAQDLDLGNYPLSSVVSALQVAQTQGCAPSVTELSGSPNDLSGC